VHGRARRSGERALAVAVALVVPGNWHIVVAGVIVSGVAALVLAPEAA
jgi:hypothetical protein